MTHNDVLKPKAGEEAQQSEHKNNDKKTQKSSAFAKARIIIPTCIFIVLSIGLIFGISTGTLCGFGWDDIALMCPLGALETALATKTGTPRVLITIVVMAILVFIFGRAFCSWICPTTLLNKLKNFFASPKKREGELAAKELHIKEVSQQEIAELKASKEHACGACGACGSLVPKKPSKLDSRHAVLGGALLSTAIFGFPVFCLICPVGLSFATVLVISRAFMFGDTTWSILLSPALLIIEIFFLRKWCTNFCPISALMNLVSRFSRTLVPSIDDSKCLETAHGASCSKCAIACEWDINIRHPEFSERDMRDCTRCHACVDVCPAGAISMPLVYKKPKLGKGTQVVLEESKLIQSDK